MTSSHVSLRAMLRGWALDALALALPTTCAGCGAPDRELCDGCRDRLSAAPVRVTTPDGLPVFAGASYADLVREVVVACKAGRTGLARPLARLLRAACAEAAPDAGVEVCAVPSTRAAYRRRGFDPARVLVVRAGWRDARALHPARPHRVQKRLGREERRGNLRGVHRARRALRGRRFVLVDDVVTTGATLDDAARAIREAGGTVVAAVTVAATPLRNGLYRDGVDAPEIVW